MTWPLDCGTEPIVLRIGSNRIESYTTDNAEMSDIIKDNHQDCELKMKPSREVGNCFHPSHLPESLPSSLERISLPPNCEVMEKIYSSWWLDYVDDMSIPQWSDTGKSQQQAHQEGVVSFNLRRDVNTNAPIVYWRVVVLVLCHVHESIIGNHLLPTKSSS